MEDKKRWQFGFFASLLFHVFFLCILVLFVGVSANSLPNKDEIVEIDYITDSGGGGGGGSDADVNEPVLGESAVQNQSGDQIFAENESVIDNGTESKRENTGAQTNAGSNGGIGTGAGTGVGSGTGSGSGSGSGGGDGSGHGTGKGNGSGGGQNKVTTPPRLISSREPDYPEEARRSGFSGTVKVKALVNAGGAVESVSVARSSGQTLLDNAALAAVRKWRFQAAKNGAGNTVSCYVNLDVEFNLK